LKKTVIIHGLRTFGKNIQTKTTDHVQGILLPKLF